MINIYKKDEKAFDHNGIGSLKDISYCMVTESLNGEFTADIEYTRNSKYSEYMDSNYIIKLDAGLEEKQLFRIKTSQQDLDTINITAEHITYDLVDNLLEDVYPQNLSGSSAINWLLGKTQFKHNFVGFSDITKTGTARYVRKNPMQALIGDIDNSFINVWGGEIERNNFKIKMLQRRGQDNGYKIKHKKNLTGLDFTTDDSEIATRLFPIAADELMLPEKYVDSPYINNYPHPKIKIVELKDIKVKENSDEDSEGFTTKEEAYEAMRKSCIDLFDNDNIDKPKINVKVDFIDLYNTTEYKKYKHLKKLKLGDTVHVIIDNMNIQVRVIKTVYDSLMHEFTNLELGEFKDNYVTDFEKNVSKTVKKETEVLENSILDQAKENATKQLTSALGGYVYKTKNELFIMDTDKPSTSEKVWRWNLNGLGYSKKGINGPYELAMTQDGSIVADFITAGKLDVSIIKGLDEISILAKQLKLEGYTTINNGFSIDENGNMTCKNATCDNITIKNSAIREGNIELKSTGGNSSFSVTDTSNDRINSELSAMLLNFNSNEIRNAMQCGIIQNSGNGFLSVEGDIDCYALHQTSKAEKKKNIEIFENALDLVKKSDVFLYNYKHEKDTDKKHIGLVIGKNYNIADEVVSQNGDAIDTYSMTSVLWQAVRELATEISKLKGGKNEKNN